MSSSTPPSWLAYWNRKQPADNAWHPVPGGSATKYVDNLPQWVHKFDIEATSVDVAPFVAGAGAMAYLSQLNQFGLTAPASIFKNRPTIIALHRSALYLTPVLLACQAAGFEYRYYIPRWANDYEKRRDEEQVRRHVDFGMVVGAGIMLTRTAMRKGPPWSLMEIVLGGALADLALREYFRAHNL